MDGEREFYLYNLGYKNPCTRQSSTLYAGQRLSTANHQRHILYGRYAYTTNMTAGDETAGLHNEGQSSGKFLTERIARLTSYTIYFYAYFSDFFQTKSGRC